MSGSAGRVLGSYRLVREIGRGGFAVVYLGEHVHLTNPAAVKVLSHQLNAKDLARFQREARILAGLDHPRIVRILDFGIAEGTAFLVMTYAPEGTVADRHAGDTVLPHTTVVEYVGQLADALQYAHDRDVVHRDVKPENVLVAVDGGLMLTDFGIAVGSSTSRQTTTAAGTAVYMAPEQIEGRAGPASDQYALAVLAFAWLCGSLPYTGTFLEVCAQHLHAPVPALRDHDDAIPELIDRCISRAMAKDPSQRYACVAKFSQALADAAAGVTSATDNPTEATVRDPLIHRSEPSGTQPLPNPSHPELLKQRKRRRLVAAAALTALLLAASALAWGLPHGRAGAAPPGPSASTHPSPPAPGITTQHTPTTVVTIAAGNTAGGTATEGNNGGGATTTSADTGPAAPTGLVASATYYSIHLSWKRAAGGSTVAGYQLLRDGTQLAAANGTSYTDTGLGYGITHLYGVIAVGANGKTSRTVTISATTITPAFRTVTRALVSVNGPGYHEYFADNQQLPPGAAVEARWHLLADAQPNSQPLYLCRYVNNPADYYPALDSTCEGAGTGPGVLAGWVTTLSLPGTGRLYRCRSTVQNDHLLTQDPNCEVPSHYIFENPLGWAWRIS
jgi:serine/threonine protein kinase